MSMLAERRSKKKWCLNPNGKDWSNDDSKFGQRMLEKMGWKKGCGLGVNLQGMKEHVRVTAKNDTKGLGCKNNSDTEWIHHQQNFENLLSQLASSTNEEIRPPGTSETKLVSLEEKSKKSRVRVHYQKFTRGKDVARYSANDLACIFGKKCNSLESKSFEMQYSCHVNTRNISEADSGVGIISDEHTTEQGLNLYKEKTTDDCVPSLLPKHSGKDQPMLYCPEDKGVQEKQNDILKEISNMEENSVAVLDIVEECTSEVLDNSASHSSAEPLQKIRRKKKKKDAKKSENNQEVITDTIVSSPQDEVNDCDTVVRGKSNEILKEISNVKKNSVAVLDIVEECTSEVLDNSASHSSAESLQKIRSKRKRKCVKDSENNQEVVTETMVSSPQDEVNDCDTLVDEVEQEKKKRKKKKKEKKNKVIVDDCTGKEDKILIEEVIEVISDAEETGNKDLENAGSINKADTRGSKIKMKKTVTLYQTNISEAQEECPQMKKKKKKKTCAQSLNEPDFVGDIKSEIVSPLTSDNEARVNNMQKSRSSASELFYSYKNESNQYDNNNAVKNKKIFRKLRRKSMEFGFRGSNLHSISGYGSL